MGAQAESLANAEAKKRKKSSLKKPKAGKQKKSDNGGRNFHLERGVHSYGVQPLGNMFLSSSGINTRDTGLGNLKVLSDTTVLEILSLLGPRDTCRLALVSRGFYVYAHHEELWRTWTLEKLGGQFDFDHNWKRTYQQGALPNNDTWKPHKPMKVRGFYSDHLFQSWLCASVEVKPEWVARDNIPRRCELSLEDFIRDFEEPGRPVIITDALATWPALQKWDHEYLVRHAGQVAFAAGPVDITLERFQQYARRVQEERPLYIFDPEFGEKAPQLSTDYSVPLYFREDLFSLLESGRPHYRWLIAGPARSGSSWHIDPNATSAWNAVVRGSKKWILFPPGAVPPGVHPSPDGADVAAPVSITEWFMNFYADTRKGDVRPVEGVCRAGEVLFVPHGWWHLVINLEDSVAITQNFVSRRNVLSVLEFLNRPNACQLVSGTSERESLHDRFLKRYEDAHPGSLQELRRAAQEKADRKQKKAAFWDTVADNSTGGFSFGFGTNSSTVGSTTSAGAFKFNF
eukprot:jgi/Mesen1/10440/ME000082S09943